jgi:hypothetical protein
MAIAFLLLAVMLFAMGIVLIRYGLGLKVKADRHEPRPQQPLNRSSAP